MKIKNPISANAACKSSVCIPAYIVMALSGIMGVVSLAFFAVFLYIGLPSQMDFGLDEQSKFIINTLLCFLFSFNTASCYAKGFVNGFPVLFPQNTLAHSIRYSPD